MAPAAAALDVEATAPLVSPEQLKKPLKFAWDQSDQFVKVYVDVDVSIDRSTETDQDDGSSVSAPAADDISLETPDDWTAILSVGRSHACKLANLCHRIDTAGCSFKLKKSGAVVTRVTVYLKKKDAKENAHWFNLFQKRG